MAFPFSIRIRLSRIAAISGLAFALTLHSCEQQDMTPAQTDEPIVAQIGDRVITAKEFRNNYEVGFAHLKSGPNPKRTFLEYMIREKLLALKGYQLDLDQSPYVKNNERRLRDELMIEALLDKEVKSKIKVSPEEIRNEINKSKVNFKFRYWVEPTKEKANLVTADMRKRGYAEVLDDIIHSNPERKIDPKDYETDYLTYLEVPAEVLNAIKDLPYGDISDPLEINGKYFIFQVLDIRRNSVTENEYKARAGSFEQIIFYRKYQEEIANYTTDLMQSKNVVTKKEAFNLLAHAINEWLKIRPEQRMQFRQQVNQATNLQPALMSLKNNLGSTFFTYKDGNLSVEMFLDYFNQSRFLRQLKEKNDFGDALNLEVRNAIRDYFFVRDAKRLQLQDSPMVQTELNLWRDKWVFEEIRHYLTRDLRLDDEDVKRYFLENKNRYKINKRDEPRYSAFRSAAKQDAYRYQVNLILENEVKSLKEQYPVTINQAVLDTISVGDLGKSNRINFQVFKGGTNRLAFPGVDPIWEPQK